MSAGNVAAALLSAGRDDAPALLARGEVVSHGSLRARVDALARALAAAGHAKGARVGLLAENGVFFAVGYLAILRAGLCAVPVATSASAAELGAIARTTALSRLLLSGRFEELGGEAVRLGVPVWDEARAGAAAAAAPPAAFFEIEPRRDLAALMFTSGSTGLPKGVMVSHGNIAANTTDIVSYLGLTASDRVLAVLPFHYCYGLSLLHTHLAAGASVAVSSGFLVPEKALDELEALSCTGFAGVPSTYQMLLRRSRFRERSFPALRWLQQAGGRLPEPLVAELRDAHTGVRVFVMYGQTEATARLSYLPPERLFDKLGSIGRGLPSTTLEVLRADGTPVVPGSAEVGEIVARGGNVTLGYWDDPEETACTFRGGALFTRDLARVDADGFLWIAGRTSDFIKCLGHRVAPREIEDVLCDMPDVVEAAAFGVADEEMGEAVVAAVVARPGSALTEREVLRYANARLPNFKVPRSVTFLASLPKNESGKVRRHELAALVAGGAA